jgi:DNA-binding PadR family transcriptional regulator
MKPDDFLPLQEPTFFILLSLHGGEKHGYAIAKDVTDLSGGRVLLSTGTLYGALIRLLDQGLIVQSALEGTRGKKSYRLSQTGLIVLDGEIDRLQRLLAAARQSSTDRRLA